MLYQTIMLPLNSDEDAPPVASEQLLIVADGLGGRGAREVKDEQGVLHTNAYVASRLCVKAAEELCTPDWIDRCFDALERNDAQPSADPSAPDAQTPSVSPTPEPEPPAPHAPVESAPVQTMAAGGDSAGEERAEIIIEARTGEQTDVTGTPEDIAPKAPETSDVPEVRETLSEDADDPIDAPVAPIERVEPEYIEDEDEEPVYGEETDFTKDAAIPAPSASTDTPETAETAQRTEILSDSTTDETMDSVAESDVSKAADAPEIHDTPETPDASEKPKAQEVQEAKEMPEAQEATEAPETPETQDTVNAQEAREEQPPSPVQSEQEILRGIAYALGIHLRDSMQSWWNAYYDGEWMPSGMFRRLPTTLAMMLVHEREHDVDVVSLWCGDSRCYALTEDGLAQISDDHLESNPDFYELLCGDYSMSNMINLCKDFTISARRCVIPKPCILFTASDGVFMYLPSQTGQPNALQLEYTLLSKMNTPTFEEGLNKLNNILYRVASDDSTLAMGAYYNQSYKEVHRMIQRRGNTFKTLYCDEWKALASEPSNAEACELSRRKATEAFDAYAAELNAALPSLFESDDAVIREYEAYACARRESNARAAQKAAEREALNAACQEKKNKLITSLSSSWTDLRKLNENALPSEVAALIHKKADEQAERDMRRLERSREKITRLNIAIETKKQSHAGACAGVQAEIERLACAREQGARAMAEEGALSLKPFRARGVLFLRTTVKLRRAARKIDAQQAQERTALACVQSSMASRAAELFEVIERTPDAGRGLCTRDVPEAYGDYIQAVEALSLFDGVEAHRQLEENASMLASLLADAEAPIAYLAEKRYDSGEAAHAYWQAENERDRTLYLNQLYKTQWEKYRANYERLMRVPAEISDAITAPAH